MKNNCWAVMIRIQLAGVDHTSYVIKKTRKEARDYKKVMNSVDGITKTMEMRQAFKDPVHGSLFVSSEVCY